ELLKEVSNLLVNVLRLADDQAQVVLIARNRARAANFLPALGGDGAGDEFGEAVEVRLGASTQTARTTKGGLAKILQTADPHGAQATRSAKVIDLREHFGARLAALWLAFVLHHGQRHHTRWHARHDAQSRNGIEAFANCTRQTHARIG